MKIFLKLCISMKQVFEDDIISRFWQEADNRDFKKLKIGGSR